MKTIETPETEITDAEVAEYFNVCWHWYKKPKSREPQPGDVALCGKVKSTPHDPTASLKVPPCPLCQAIKATRP